MGPGGWQSVVGGRSRPRVACPTCGLRIPLDAVVVTGRMRTLSCERCHAVEIWNLNTAEIDLRD